MIENCRPWGEREEQTVLIEGEKIVRTLSGRKIADNSSVRRLDANGGALYPGFADTHCHPFEFGWLKRNVDLRGAANITGLRLRLFARVQRSKQGEWVTGMGWDQEAFTDGRMPNRSDIDDITKGNPVVLTRVCGHIALVNTVAIERLGFERRQGPEFARDAEGRLTGIVKEGALEEVYASMPRSADACEDYLLAAESEATRCGLTSLHAVLSVSGYAEELQALASLDSSRSLALRYRVYVPPEALAYLEGKGLRARLSSPHLKIGGVKVYADGSLGARTAALREEYSDDPGNYGMLRYGDEELGETIERADKAGYQVIVHAIGDRAVEQTIEALSRVTGARNPKRHRVEHASLLPRDLMSKMAKHGIRSAVQPLFITSDSWAAARLGRERVTDLYPLKSMLSEGVVASGSSDSPIEQMNPLLGIWAAMVRGRYAPEEALSLDDGLALYTKNATSNGFDEAWSGSLVEGAEANITLLDSDLRDMHPAMIRKVGVAATIVCGEIAHTSSGFLER